MPLGTIESAVLSVATFYDFLSPVTTVCVLPAAENDKQFIELVQKSVTEKMRRAERFYIGVSMRVQPTEY